MRSSSFAILSLALSLYAASLSNAESLRAPPKAKARQLSDANLFEVHLQKPASSHKRIPSEILKDHQERDEVVEPVVLPSTTTAASTAGPSSTAASSSSSSSATSPLSAATVEVTFTPRQPSHFIIHRRTKHGKRRLPNSLPAQVTFKRDDDDLSMFWDVQSLVVSVLAGEAGSNSMSTLQESSSEPEAPAETQAPSSPSS